MPLSEPGPRAAIVGVSGPRLTADETALLEAMPPAGVILFGRNVADPAQVLALTTDLRRILPAQAAILVDQEGGRVARLRPPGWTAHPVAGAIGALYDRDRAAGLRAAWLQGALIGSQCAAAGFDVVCAPVLDVRAPGASEVVGDRAFGTDAQAVAALGGAMIEGMLAAGVQPVAKHAPGHGRGMVDSHLALPEVESVDAADLLPFQRNAGVPWLMTAHMRYRQQDPANPATLSAAIIAEVIRGRIAFAGVLVSDDLAMGALTGEPDARAAAALAAGCDVALYCPGDARGTRAVLAACPALSAIAVHRIATARALAAARHLALDPAAMETERALLLA